MSLKSSGQRIGVGAYTLAACRPFGLRFHQRGYASPNRPHPRRQAIPERLEVRIGQVPHLRAVLSTLRVVCS